MLGAQVVFDPASADISSWEQTGGAFHIVQPPLPYHDEIIEDETHPVLTSFDEGIEIGETATGSITTPPFKITKDYLNVRIGGPRRFAEHLGAQLFVDGKLVNAMSGRDRASMRPQLRDTAWDVRGHRGKTAFIRFNDFNRSGALWIGCIALENEPKSLLVDAAEHGKENFRPRFHHTTPEGYMHDPNGLFYMDGLWHMPFQYNLVGANGVNWGHSVSKDLIHWEYIGFAIPADERGMSWAGSAWVDHDNRLGFQTGEKSPVILFHTLCPPGSSSWENQPGGVLPYEPRGRPNPPPFVCAIAVSTDGGMTFEKHTDALFEPEFSYDRDPHGFWHEPSQSWVILWHVAGRENKNIPGQTCFAVYVSKDFKNWRLTQKLYSLWEEPNLLTMYLDGDKNKPRLVMIEGKGNYAICTFDGEHFTFDPKAVYPNDEIYKRELGEKKPAAPEAAGYQPDAELTQGGRAAAQGSQVQEIKIDNVSDFFYPQSYGEYYATGTFTNAPDGRTVEIAWCATSKAIWRDIFIGMPFMHQMTIPMELSLKTTPEGVRLFHWPVKELEGLRGEKISVKGKALKPGSPLELKSPSELLDCRAVVQIGDAQEILITVNGQRIVWSRADNMFLYTHPLRTVRVPAPFVKDEIDLRILVDKTLFEAFFHDGIRHLHHHFFVNEIPRSIKVEARGGKARLKLLEAWAINP